MTKTSVRPPFDAELGAVLAAMPPFPTVSDETIEAQRGASAVGQAAIAEGVERLGLTVEERTIPGPGGDIVLGIVRRADSAGNAPAMYNIHGGGMIMGDRYFFMSEAGQLQWVADWDVVLVTVEYRLAPEHPGPAGAEDCYAGLVWTYDHAEELGIDPTRIIVGGISGGGGLAAAVALISRDRSGPPLLAQLLITPMLDDKNDTVSALQYTDAAGVGGADSYESNVYLWKCVLGPGHTDRAVSYQIAPARATDLSGLPPAFIDVGSAEVFRDEAVAYASLMWASGSQAELHVWAGAFHTSDIMAPTIPVSVAARNARNDWVRRTWGV